MRTRITIADIAEGSRWTKLFVNLFPHDLWQQLSLEHRCVLVVLFAVARYSEGHERCKACGQLIPLPIGGFIASTREISELAGVGRQSARSALKQLESVGFLRQEDPNTGSTRGQHRCHVIYILEDWEEFVEAHPPQDGATQPITPYINRSTEYIPRDPSTPTPDTTSQPSNTTKRRTTPTLDSLPQEARDISAWWMAQLDYYQDRPKERDKHLPTWAQELDRLHRLDGLSWEDIRELVEWIAQDTGGGKWTGWSKNCRTPKKLRTRGKDDLPYWHTIQSQMRAQKRDRATGLRRLNWYDPNS